MSDITAKEGIKINLDLRLTLDNLNIDDESGTFQLGSEGSGGVTIDNGRRGRAELKGLTFDVSGDNQLVLGLPSGYFSASVDEIYLSNPGSANPVGPLNINDVNFGKSEIRVGPN